MTRLEVTSLHTVTIQIEELMGVGAVNDRPIVKSDTQDFLILGCFENIHWTIDQFSYLVLR